MADTPHLTTGLHPTTRGLRRCPTPTVSRAAAPNAPTARPGALPPLPAFGGDSVVETLDAVRHRTPEPPTRLNARVPRDLETICLKCLEKDPRRRYQSAQTLADDLRFAATR
jgi:serine/threonine protein kinase